MPKDKEVVILSEEQIAKIEARAEKATKGPWDSPANKQPWPDEASRLESIVCGDGGYINHRNWKEVCLNMDFISQAREDVPALCGTVRALRTERVRLLDLVRYCRHQLHEEGLITTEDLAALLEAGPGSVRRLESYDNLQAHLKEVTTERDALLKEVAASEGYQTGLVSKGE